MADNYQRMFGRQQISRKGPKYRITHEECARAMTEYAKKGGLIRKLSPQVTPNRLIGPKWAEYEPMSTDT